MSPAFSNTTSTQKVLIMGSISFMGPVNTGNPGEFTVLQLAKTIAPLPSDDPKQGQPDIALANARLGWGPKVNLEGGLKETITHVKTLLARK